jgi:hypothetical protein
VIIALEKVNPQYQVKRTNVSRFGKKRNRQAIIGQYETWQATARYPAAIAAFPSK